MPEVQILSTQPRSGVTADIGKLISNRFPDATVNYGLIDGFLTRTRGDLVVLDQARVKPGLFFPYAKRVSTDTPVILLYESAEDIPDRARSPSVIKVVAGVIYRDERGELAALTAQNGANVDELLSRYLG